VLVGVHSFAEWFLRERVAERMLMDLRVTLFDTSLRSAAVARGTRDHNDTIYRITHDARCLQWTLVYGALPVAVSLASVAAMIAVMVRLSPKAGVVALATCVPLGLMVYLSQQRLRDRWHRVKNTESDALAVVQEALGSLYVVTAFGQEAGETQRFVARSRDTMRSRLNVIRLQGTLGLVLGCTTALGTGIVLYLGVRDTQAKLLSVGELLLVMAYVGQLYVPLQAIASRIVDQQSAIASTQRVFNLLAAEPGVPERPGAVPVTRARGEFVVRHVSFAYPGRAATLADVSVDIPSGSLVGIVGETGAGKTTLVNLLMRQIDPDRGQILLDGVDLRDCKVADLRRQFAVVAQDAVVFSTTIVENITYGSPDAPLEQIVSAAKQARAHDFIERLPRRYETPITGAGRQLSAGERQRISLARAFLRDAPILVLDEPTSAIDIRTEQSLVDAIRDLARGRTTLLITHRLGMLRDADLILYVESGRVVAKQAPAEILRV